MKTTTKNIFFILIVAVSLAGCLNKTTTTKKTGSSSSGQTGNNGGGNNNGGGSGSGSGSGEYTIPGCDGRYKESASRCYYDNFPIIRVSGTGLYGPVYWSSTNPTQGSAGGSLQQNQFVSDRYIAIRMIPERVVGAHQNSQYPVYSTTGHVCAAFITNSTSLKVKVRLAGEIKELKADYSQTSNVVYFSNLTGSVNNLEVVEVLSNARCKMAGGSNPQYCPYADIPLVAPTSGPTECVGIKFQMATDTTFDFPN